jgi:hypothetical protein
MTIQDYFTEEKIIRILCKYRALQSGKRHDMHMINNFSIHPKNNIILQSQEKSQFKEISELFPSRRKWKKLYRSEREKCKDSLTSNRLRLYNSYKRTKREIELNNITSPDWYLKLINYVKDIQNVILTIETGNFNLEPPKIAGIKKDEKDGIITYRPIAVYDTKSKIICSLTAKYFTDFFDPYFLDCSYAFRAVNQNKQIPTHHDCIKKIAEKRKKNNRLWVAECDIQKFFDIVNHEHLLKVFNNLSQKIEQKDAKILDPKSKIILDLFLKSYSFQKNILSLNDNIEWFKNNNLPKGKFGWIDKKLNEAFGEDYCENNSIGVPQGNAISCFIANLILHEVDEKVISSDSELFYIRYCDDMILLHSEHSKCEKGLNVFMSELKNNYLLYHPPTENLNYKVDSHIFWNESKSKLPYVWGDKNISNTNIPWLSFVGYQINFDGRIRVRKKTLIKETKKQVSETQKIIINLGKTYHFQKVRNQHSRWSKRQILFSLQQRLISMSVGRVKIYNHTRPNEFGMCWTNGFKILKHNKIASKQLRYLDRRRRHQLSRLKHALNAIEKKSEKTTFEEDDIYYGSAFSYYNYLKNK